MKTICTWWFRLNQFMNNNDKILITGTAGFIGFHLAKNLLLKNESKLCIKQNKFWLLINIKVYWNSTINNHHEFLVIIIKGYILWSTYPM